MGIRHNLVKVGMTVYHSTMPEKGKGVVIETKKEGSTRINPNLALVKWQADGGEPNPNWERASWLRMTPMNNEELKWLYRDRT